MKNIFSAKINETYGQRVRVRVCGICIIEGKILLANHNGLQGKPNFWCPPGGGVATNELAETALIREYLEECNLGVLVQDFIGYYEFISENLHAVELFFEVKIVNGHLALGTDPEMELQILSELKWFSKSEILAMPKTEIHKAVLDFLKK
jgi:8-oxo-dGTP diphosphatase